MNPSNNVVPLHTPNKIDEEASIWLVRLDSGNLSEQSRKELKAWLAADERHQVALKAMAEIWDDMDEILNNIDEKASSNKISLWAVLKPVTAPAMLAASISFIALFIWLMMPLDVTKNSYITVKGQQIETTFKDGSIIHLNTDSHIETEFSAEKRLVKLIKGEALFEVAHDANRPFIVYAGDRLVQAIGTKFVVHLKPKNIQVTVTDGKVKMSKVHHNANIADIKALDNTVIQKDDVYLTKGEKAVVAENKTPTLTHVASDNMTRELSWLDGQLIFDNEALFDVIEEINRYIDVTLVLKEPSLHDIKISGRFELGDSEALIEALELSFNIESQRLGSNKILLTKKA
ncbi:FecR domain-containing protein [Thalassotalea sp. 1_MG-2023]|uniref:FecR family protein n=1 Tax=Thalassotalea sp. 1_MG-2023 TaxID=3062680 RepID=UPI0026E25737|nr:FecR domain-containing protein [Thalassotalea sp. 1_MG-2023]MDO6426776.1 FecR domain-containing protein [Thalassotalea sp. 1_MG-2023]